MAAILTINDFTGEILIAGLTRAWNEDSISGFISKYESDYIYKAMGYALGKAFIAGIAAVTVDQKWTDILEGAEYYNADGKLRKWAGLQAEGANPIANYVYYWYQRNAATITGTAGEGTATVENATKTSSINKSVRAWNEMADITDLLRDFLEYKLDGDDVAVYDYDSEEVHCFGRINTFNL